MPFHVALRHLLQSSKRAGHLKYIKRANCERIYCREDFLHGYPLSGLDILADDWVGVNRDEVEFYG